MSNPEWTEKAIVIGFWALVAAAPVAAFVRRRSLTPALLRRTLLGSLAGNVVGLLGLAVVVTHEGRRGVPAWLSALVVASLAVWCMAIVALSFGLSGLLLAALRRRRR